MFPIPFNFPFIKKNGERTTIGAAIDAAGSSDPYVLPTASAATKGGVKIGTGLSMDGEVLNATGGSGATIYYKTFINANPSSWSQFEASGMYYGSVMNIAVTGYTPIGCFLHDKGSGWGTFGNVMKDGDNVCVYVQSRKNTKPSMDITVYYVLNTDLTEITT